MVLRRILGAALAAALVLGLEAPPAFADPATRRTFTASQLCRTGGEVTYDAGAITIDLGKLAPGVTEVEIATGAVGSCQREMTSLNWTGTHHLDRLIIGEAAFSQYYFPNTLVSVSFPADLASLEIGASAFYQQASSEAGKEGPNTLAAVTFPDGLANLSIGNSAFDQNATSGSNALASVTFPASLTSLVIGASAFLQQAPGANRLRSVVIGGTMPSLSVGEGAFYQYSEGGDNALDSVSFPAGLTSLQLGNQAFNQSASGRTALTSVSFPSGLQTLQIGDQAFYQYTQTGATTLATVRFPGRLTTLAIGQDAFRQAGTPALARVMLDQTVGGPRTRTMTVSAGAFAMSVNPTWYWFGADGTSLQDAWGGTINAAADFATPNLLGYRTLSFDGQGGDAPGTWYVYPGVPIGYPRPRVMPRLELGTDWTVALPTATRPGFEQTGWCPGLASACPFAPGDTYTLTVASRTLYASWALLPPALAASLDDATVGTAYQVTVATGAGRVTCEVTSGTLPPGLTLGGCELSGTPTVAGKSTFTITATNSAGPSSREYTLRVLNVAPTITTTALPTGKVTVPYTATIAVSGGGTITCAVSAGALPPGLVLSKCGLSGTPTKAGSYPVTITATNDGGSGSKALTLSIAAAKKFTKVYKPTISGTAKVGKTLKAKVKTWKPKPAKLTWQWYRNGVAISGATKSSYKLVKADKGKRITVVVVGTRIGYQSSASSKSTAKVK